MEEIKKPKTIHRVVFTVEGKTYEVLARELDFSRSYFVGLADLYFADQSQLVVTPYGDEARKRFGEAQRLLLPAQAILVIEEIPARDKIRRLSVAREDEA